jgi:hypothetical protein
MKKLLLILVLAVPQVSCQPVAGCLPMGSCTRILFIGNSFTQVNDLPATFSALAAAGGHGVDAEMLTTGGATFAEDATSVNTQTTIASKSWDFVVLQEQSQRPSVADFLQTQTIPAATTLVSEVRAAHSTPLFFETWAHKKGWPENGLATYQSMQDAIDKAYRQMGQQFGVAVAPVGEAWDTAQLQGVTGLWQSDGVHPTVAGTYLAACVFYGSLFHQSPLGLGFSDGLSSDLVLRLQRIAGRAAV